MRQLGPYTEGEVPASLSVAFVDAAGDPIPLTGFTAQWLMQRGEDEPIARAAIVMDPATGGEVAYVWQEGDLVEGNWRGEMWVAGASNTLCSERYRWTVGPAVVTPTFP